MNTALLLIGRPHSGKTTFIAQLCGRAEQSTSALKLYKPVDDLTPVIEAVRALANGDEVKTTPTDKSTLISLPLQFHDQKIDLDCPDYGGEQINHLLESREVDLKWTESIKNSNNWILFVKPSDLSSSYDLSNKTISPEILANSNGDSDEYSISDQTFFIELLQVLLHTKGQDSHFKNSSVKLTVVLTCWDELNSKATPEKEFTKALPLLLDFIKANWADKQISVLGLSSLGMSLKENGNKLKYQENGSENFGYLVNADGQRTNDITQLVIQAL